MHRSLPIITTTTRSRNNPGDTYIGVGLQWLVEQVTGSDTPWFLVNKFDREQFAEAIPEMQRAGIALYAGTPQYNRFSDWKFWYDDELWRKHINPAGVPVAVFAGGAGHPHADISPAKFARELSEDRKTRKIMKQRAKNALCFTVRDPHSAAFLERMEIEHHYLPCSATFSGHYYRVTPRVQKGRVAIVSAKPTFVHGESPEDVIARFLSIHEAVREEGFSPVMVCHNVQGYMAYRDLLPQQEVFYSNDYHPLLKFYATCEGIVSARLHATLPAFGIGSVTRLVNISIDVRGNAVEALGLPNLRYGDADAATVVGKLKHGVIDSEFRARQLESTAAKYGAVISEVLRKVEWPGLS